jgi:hypothetical protein
MHLLNTLTHYYYYTIPDIFSRHNILLSDIPCALHSFDGCQKVRGGGHLPMPPVSSVFLYPYNAKGVFQLYVFT